MIGNDHGLVNEERRGQPCGVFNYITLYRGLFSLSVLSVSLYKNKTGEAVTLITGDNNLFGQIS